MKFLIPVFLFALTISGLVWLFSPTQTAPDVALNFTNGERKMLTDYRGEAVLITFWSVTCQLCIKDIPHLNQLQANGLTVLGVSMPHDPPPVVLKLLKKFDIQYPTVLDVHREINQEFGGVRLTPTHFLLNSKGEIVLHSLGAINVDKIQAAIAAM